MELELLTAILGQTMGRAADVVVWVLCLLAALALRSSMMTFWARVLVQTLTTTAIMVGVSAWIGSMNPHTHGFDYIMAVVSYLILCGLAAMIFGKLVARKRLKRAKGTL